LRVSVCIAGQPAAVQQVPAFARFVLPFMRAIRQVAGP
jgi:hypothetical protein